LVHLPAGLLDRLHERSGRLVEADHHDDRLRRHIRECCGG
jgi:hypothetical protein